MEKLTFNVVSTLILALGAATTTAYAVGSGMYLGGQLGSSNTHNVVRNVQTNSIPATIAVRPKNTGLGERLFLGYQFNEYAGMEAGFTHYAASDYNVPATVSCNNPALRENAFDLVGKGIIPFSTSGFSVFAKAGLAVVSTGMSGSLNTNTTLNACGSSTSNNTVRPTVGIGAGYDLSQNWVADLSWARVLPGGQVKAADLVAVGVSYHFVDKMCGSFLC
jgi:OOP family OmpA-OmpF porin